MHPVDIERQRRRQETLMEVIYEVMITQTSIKDRPEDKLAIRLHWIDTCDEWPPEPPTDQEIDSALRRMVWIGTITETLLREVTPKKSPRHPGTVTRSIFSLR